MESTIKQHIEGALMGEPPLSYKSPEAQELCRKIGALTPREVFEVGAATLQLVLDRHLAGAHTEREMQILRDKSNPFC